MQEYFSYQNVFNHSTYNNILHVVDKISSFDKLMNLILLAESLKKKSSYFKVWQQRLCWDKITKTKTVLQLSSTIQLSIISLINCGMTINHKRTFLISPSWYHFLHHLPLSITVSACRHWCSPNCKLQEKNTCNQKTQIPNIYHDALLQVN